MSDTPDMNDPVNAAKQVTDQALLDSAFLLAYKDSRGENTNRIMNREDFRKGWNQCLIAMGVGLQVPSDVWDKYVWRGEIKK